MEQEQSFRNKIKQPKHSFRMSFEVRDGKINLVNSVRLPMICPLSFGAPPNLDIHEGFWVEVRNSEGTVVFFKILNVGLLNSVEVFEKDGTIKRIYGKPEQVNFEILIPDMGKGHELVFVGDSLKPVANKRVRKRKMKELASFSIESTK